MSELRHWHPVSLSRRLGKKPRAVTVCDTDLVVYRTASGGVGALRDECPHRRMRLSEGWVDGEAIVCPYHGFRYALDGEGQSPATPQLKLCAVAYEAVDRHGAIWVREKGSDAVFPTIGRDGYYSYGVLQHDIHAPLEPCLDNFSEVEHTPTTHALFGYRAEAMAQVETETRLTADTVRVINRGPQKPVPAYVEKLFNVHSDDDFVDDWTVHFSPVHIHYHQYWVDRASDAARPDQIHLAVFFTPIDRDSTRVMTFVHLTRDPRARFGFDWIVARPIMLRLIDHEVRLDKRMIEQLADPDPDLRGTRLGRFDKALRENRKRIEAIYRASGSAET